MVDKILNMSYGSFDVTNNRYYKVSLLVVGTAILSAITIGAYLFATNEAGWSLFLFPICAGLISLSFIIYLRLKRGGKIW